MAVTTFFANSRNPYLRCMMHLPPAVTTPVTLLQVTAKTVFFSGALLFLLLAFHATSSASANPLFPVFPSMVENVHFWEQVYSRYTTRQGILHDKDDLGIIYAVVNLQDWNTAGSSRKNRKMIKKAKKHYRSILADLAAGKKPRTAEEHHIASLFPANSRLALKKARNNLRLQIGQKDRFAEGVIRSGAYLPAIRKIFRAYKLPEELAYLPHVESSFNPEAHSKAGASGLWQFTRSTGRQYMRIDHVLDMRLDPYYATRAAAIFLQENFEALGSWPLAITAYNHGRNGMLRAVSKKGGYEQIFLSHSSRLFRFASRNFYSEFIAALKVARRLERELASQMDRPEATLFVKMEGFARADDIRSHFHLSGEDFSRLNPSLRKPVLSGKKYIPKGLYVRIPANPETHDLAASLPRDMFHSHQIRDREYIVRQGDTAGAIARRYRIPLAELIAANNLNRHAMIRLGQKLKIPSKETKEGGVPVTVLKPASKNKPD